jgi:hypothetical protein
MAPKFRKAAGVIFLLGCILNLGGCVPPGTPQSQNYPGETASQGGAYQQEQRNIWIDPHGSGASTDWSLYMDSQGGGP